MTVLKVDFVGIRTNRLDETVALFRDVLGVQVARQSDEAVRFRLADNTLLELYGPRDEFHAFFATGPVVAFRVDDFASRARRWPTRASSLSAKYKPRTASAGSTSTVPMAPSWS